MQRRYLQRLVRCRKRTPLRQNAFAACKRPSVFGKVKEHSFVFLPVGQKQFAVVAAMLALFCGNTKINCLQKNVATGTATTAPAMLRIRETVASGQEQKPKQILKKNAGTQGPKLLFGLVSFLSLQCINRNYAARCAPSANKRTFNDLHQANVRHG